MAVNDKSGGEKPYDREELVVVEIKRLLEDESMPREDYNAALKEILKNYERLLSDTKVLTSVGDRLQRKLKSANLMLREQQDEILRKNEQLNEKNIELELTLDALTRAKASRTAQVIITVLVALLFIFSEKIEGYLDDSISKYLPQLDNDKVEYVSLLVKMLLMFALRPLEGFIEEKITHSSMDKDKRSVLQRFISSKK